MIAQLILAAIGAYVLHRIGGWLLDWARRALQGFLQGALGLVKESNAIMAYAMGHDYGDLEIVEEIEVDEGDLDDAVLDALQRHGRLVQKVSL